MNQESQSGISADMLRNAEWVLIALIITASLLFRLTTLSGPLDEPSWRQVWCANQAREASREGVQDWLNVHVNFRGANDTGAWNLPLYENLVALLYMVAGGERLTLARLLTLVFYMATARVLFLIARVLFNQRVAYYSAIAFLILPLGVFYSRAVHYDVLTLLLSHVFMYSALQLCRTRRVAYVFVAQLSGIAAFLLKPPFCLYLGLPILVAAALLAPKNRPAAAVSAAGLFLLPLIAAYAHHLYRLRIEGHIAAGFLYPDPYVAGYARSWFFGVMQDRMNGAIWLDIGKKTCWHVVTPLGLYFCSVSLFTLPRGQRTSGWMVLYAWLIGLAGYTWVMFRLIPTHDYYLLPFLPPVSLVLGLFLDWTSGGGDVAPKRSWKKICRTALAVAFLVLFSLLGLRQGRYFRRDWQRIACGKAIKEKTTRNDLVVSSALGRSTGHTDPRILYHADRRGWASRFEDLSSERIAGYKAAGARYVALLVTSDRMPLREDVPWMSEYPHSVSPLDVPEGASGGMLYLYDLASERP